MPKVSIGLKKKPFSVTDSEYGPISFIDLWLCEGYSEGEGDALSEESGLNEELKIKIASAVEEQKIDLFAGFKEELKNFDSALQRMRKVLQTRFPKSIITVVVTHDGAIQLAGLAASPEEKAQIEEVAQTVAGDCDVINDLAVPR